MYSKIYIYYMKYTNKLSLVEVVVKPESKQ